MTMMLRVRKTVLAVWVCCAAVPLSAQEEQPAPSQRASNVGSLSVFQNRAFYDPLIAEVGAAQVSVMALASSSDFQYSQKKGRRRVWDITVGKEIPVFGWERQYLPTASAASSDAMVPCFATSGDAPPGCTGFGVSVPVAVHMIEDFKDPSNPVVNSDYRFGAMLKFARRLGAGPSSEPIHLLKLRLYFGHESTHLGDEFSLAAQRNQATNAFERIDVSYQYWEYGVSYEQIHGVHNFKLRHGGSVLDPLTGSWRGGYYSADPSEVNGRVVTPSRNKFEPMFGFEYLKENYPSHDTSYQPFVSLDVRYRTIYDYSKPNPGAAERAQWSYNVLAGFRRARASGDRGVPSLYVRLYYGVNPTGQFQNQRNYFLFGAGLQVMR